MTNDRKSFYEGAESDGFFMKFPKDWDTSYQASDEYFLIPDEYDMKPGGLAYKLYGDPQLLWVFSAFNRDILEDPIWDFRAGTIIRIPSKSRVMNSL